MKITNILKLSIVGISTNKARSLLTVLGIIIGIAAVIALMAIGNGAQSDVLAEIDSLGTNVVRIIPGKQDTFRPGQLNRDKNNAAAASATLDQKDYDFLNNSMRFPNIINISPLASGQQSVQKDSKEKKYNVNGVAHTFNSIQNITIEYGTFLKQRDIDNTRNVAVIGPAIVEDLFPGQAKKSIIGSDITLNNLRFQIVGILTEKGSTLMSSPDEEIYIPYTTAISKVLLTDKFTSIHYKIGDENLINITNARITEKLAKFRKVDEDDLDFTLFTSNDLQDLGSQVTGTFTALLASIASISLVVGGIGIMNIMLVSVTERTKEIGLRKAVGANQKDIILQFLSEAVILTLIGGIAGVLLGILIGKVAGNLLDINSIISLNSILLATSVSVIIGIIFGFYPAYKAGKKDPITALRYE